MFNVLHRLMTAPGSIIRIPVRRPHVRVWQQKNTSNRKSPRRDTSPSLTSPTYVSLRKESTASVSFVFPSSFLETAGSTLLFPFFSCAFPFGIKRPVSSLVKRRFTAQNPACYRLAFRCEFKLRHTLVEIYRGRQKVDGTLQDDNPASCHNLYPHQACDAVLILYEFTVASL